MLNRAFNSSRFITMKMETFSWWATKRSRSPCQFLWVRFDIRQMDTSEDFIPLHRWVQCALVGRFSVVVCCFGSFRKVVVWIYQLPETSSVSVWRRVRLRLQRSLLRSWRLQKTTIRWRRWTCFTVLCWTRLRPVWMLLLPLPSAHYSLRFPRWPSTRITRPCRTLPSKPYAASFLWHAPRSTGTRSWATKLARRCRTLSSDRE